MTQAIAPVPAVIIVRAGPFREALERSLCPPAFRVITSKANLIDVSHGELPRSEPFLVVVECGEGPGPLSAQIAQLKQENPLARVALVGRNWLSADIATTFEAGASAYFAEAAISKEFLQAINLITR
jgi:DNA-binding NarL/FixJ family response regulator